MSVLLDKVREKYPQYSGVSDDDLALRIGTKYPAYLDSDPEFKTQFQGVVADKAIQLAKSGTSSLISVLTNPAAGEAAESGRDDAEFQRTIGQEGKPPQDSLLRAAKNWEEVGSFGTPKNTYGKPIYLGGTEITGHGVQFPLVRPPKDAGATEKVAAGLYNTGVAIPNFALSPEGIATMLAPETLPARFAGPLLKGIFAGLMAKSAGEQLGTASVTKDPQDITEGLGSLVMAGALTHSSAIEAINERRAENGKPPITGPISGLIKTLINRVKENKNAPLEAAADQAKPVAPMTAAAVRQQAENVNFLQEGTEALSTRPITGQSLVTPKGADKPDPRLVDLIQEGVKRSDAQALIAGTKTIKEVVDSNLSIVRPSRDFSQLAETPNSSFGHADAMEEGYRNAIARIGQILDQEPPKTAQAEPEAQPAVSTQPALETPQEAPKAAQGDTVSDRITAASYTNPQTGETTTGKNHIEAAKAQGVDAPKIPTQRHGEEYGFEVQNQDTGEVRYVSRDEAEEIARDNGQLLNEPQRGALHSDEVEFTPKSLTKTSSGNMPSSKSISEGSTIGSDVFSGILETPAFHDKGLGGLDIPQQRLVVARMLSGLHNSKIFQSIIKSVPVNMVNKLVALKPSADVIFHHKSMLGDLTLSDGEHSVTLPVDVANNVIREVSAFRGTPELFSTVISNSGETPDQGLAAAGAKTGDVHEVSLSEETETSTRKETKNASKIREAATIHGDVRPQSESGVRPLPTKEGSEGVQPQAEGGLSKAQKPESPEKQDVAGGVSEAKEIEVKQQGDLLEQKPAWSKEPEPVTPQTSATANTQPNQKYRIKNSGPQTYSVVERLPASEVEIANGEQPVRVKNEQTGAESVVLEGQLHPVKERTAEERATSKGPSRKELDDELHRLGMDPSEFSTLGQKKDAIRRAKEKSKGIAGSVRKKWTSATAGDHGEAGFVNIDVIRDLIDKATPYVKSAYHFIRGIGEESSKLSRTSDLRRAVLNWSGKLQTSFGESAAAQKEIISKVRDPIRRQGIINWMQSGGDPVLLSQRKAATETWVDPVTGKPHLMKRNLVAGYDAAMNLTPQEIAIANDARAAYDDLLNRGLRYGVIRAFKDNYVTQIWDLGKGPQFSGARKLKDKFRFAKASVFNNYFEGEQAGYSPKDKDIAKVLPVYLHEMNSVIAARQLAESLRDGVASDGLPLVQMKGSGNVVSGPNGQATLISPNSIGTHDVKYESIPNQPALTDWIWKAKDSAGNPIFLKADMALHPEALGLLKNILGKSAIKEWYSNRTTALAEIPKKIVQALDMANSGTKRTMLGFFAPFHQVQEGWHGVGHKTNPFFSIPKIDLVNDAGQADAAKHGLMLLPDRVSAEQFMEGFKTSGLVSYIPKIGPVADFYSHYLFHEYIPGLKYKTWQNILERNRELYSNELASGEVSLEDVKILSSEQANAAYGHLNYADLGRNPTILHAMRLGLLAPDFFEARGRFAAQAVKGLTGAKVGREQLIALATLAVAQAGLAYVGAKTTGGEWDWKHPFEFHTGSRRYTLRSVPEDISSLLNDTRIFIHSRISPIIGKGALQYVDKVDWRGQKVDWWDTTKELMQQPIPVSLRGFFGLGNQSLKTWEQLASSAGLRISRYSYVGEAHKLAQNWLKSNPDPKAQSEYKRIQHSTFPESDYKPLRDALILNDLGKAKKEYEKLRQTRDAGRIATTMQNHRPFTGKNDWDKKFFNSLNDEQKTVFLKAKVEQKELYDRFVKMKSGDTKQRPEDVLDPEIKKEMDAMP